MRPPIVFLCLAATACAGFQCQGANRAPVPSPASLAAVNPQNLTPGPLQKQLQDLLAEAAQDSVPTSLSHLQLDPQSLQNGAESARSALGGTFRDRGYSAAAAWLYANAWIDASSDVRTLRSLAVFLQSRTQSETRDHAAAQTNLALQRAESYQDYLSKQLADARTSLKAAQARVFTAERKLAFFSRIAPSIEWALANTDNIAAGLTIYSDARDLLARYDLQDENAHAAAKLWKLGLDSMTAAGGDAFWAETLGAYAQWAEKIQAAAQSLDASFRQDEAENLAFGGILSRAVLPEISFALSDYDRVGGYFYIHDPDYRLTLTGAWSTEYKDRLDQLSFGARYSFSGLQTMSGETVNGYGSVVRTETESHGPYANNPYLSWLDLFAMSDPLNRRETTIRNEHETVTFNGADEMRKMKAAEQPDVPPQHLNHPLMKPEVPQFKKKPDQVWAPSVVKKKPDPWLPPFEPPHFPPPAADAGNDDRNPPPTPTPAGAKRGGVAFMKPNNLHSVGRGGSDLRSRVLDSFHPPSK